MPSDTTINALLNASPFTALFIVTVLALLVIGIALSKIPGKNK